MAELSAMVGFVGLGIMGSRRWRRTWRAAGYELTVYNRTREKAERVGGRARRRASPARPREAARGRATS